MWKFPLYIWICLFLPAVQHFCQTPVTLMERMTTLSVVNKDSGARPLSGPSSLVTGPLYPRVFTCTASIKTSLEGGESGPRTQQAFPSHPSLHPPLVLTPPASITISFLVRGWQGLRHCTHPIYSVGWVEESHFAVTSSLGSHSDFRKPGWFSPTLIICWGWGRGAPIKGEFNTQAGRRVI